jgi:hypothetical protein
VLFSRALRPRASHSPVPRALKGTDTHQRLMHASRALEITMLYTIAVILLIAWLLGIIGPFATTNSTWTNEPIRHRVVRRRAAERPPLARIARRLERPVTSCAVLNNTQVRSAISSNWTAVMLHEFIAINREEIIRRCRAKVATRSAPPPTIAEIDHGVPCSWIN